MVSRVTETIFFTPEGGRIYSISIEDHFGPRIFFTASSTSIHSMEIFPTRVIISPS